MEDSRGYFDPKVPTLADALGASGYHTDFIAKCHLGLGSPNTWNERGFTFFHSFLGELMDSYTTHQRFGNNYMQRDTETIAPGVRSSTTSRKTRRRKTMSPLRTSKIGGPRRGNLSPHPTQRHHPMASAEKLITAATRRPCLHPFSHVYLDAFE